MLTDTHCHLDFEVFDKDRSDIIKQCLAVGIERIIVPAVSSDKWEQTLKVCHEYNYQFSSSYPQLLIPALGLHPFFLSQHNPADIALLEEYCSRGELKAIGEIGLDYLSVKQQVIKQESINKQLNQQPIDLNKPLQQFYFEQQLALAKKYHLPVLIHARKSHQDVIQLLKKYSPLKGIIHAFNGSEVQAKQYIKLGFMLGFGGAFTNPKAKHLLLLVKNLPLSAMLLESDAPDMLPFFVAKNEKNKPNTPENIIGIFEHFVLLRTENSAETELQLEKNLQNIFSFRD
jgi:TatD DNase family protein